VESPGKEGVRRISKKKRTEPKKRIDRNREKNGTHCFRLAEVLKKKLPFWRSMNKQKYQELLHLVRPHGESMGIPRINTQKR